MKSNLDKYLDNCKFISIYGVLEAFELCENFDDVQKVLGEVPGKFGTLTVELLDEEGNTYDPEDEVAEEKAELICGFRVTNIYSQYDDYAEESWDFDWYEG